MNAVAAHGLACKICDFKANSKFKLYKHLFLAHDKQEIEESYQLDFEDVFAKRYYDRFKKLAFD